MVRGVHSLGRSGLERPLKLLPLQAQQGAAEQGQESWVRLPGSVDGAGDAAGTNATVGHG